MEQPSGKPEESNNHWSDSSVPERWSNLGEYRAPVVGDDDQTVYFENNPLGEQAEDLRRDHREHHRHAELAAEDARYSQEGLQATQTALDELQHALDDMVATDPGNLDGKSALMQAIQIIRDRQDIWREQYSASVTETEWHRAGAQHAADTGYVHYRENEAAYRNQAASDYRQARASNPKKYPDQLQLRPQNENDPYAE